MDLWNKKNLEPPPISTYKATDHKIDVENLSNIMKEANRFFTNQKLLQAETALLSRCIYRMKMKFRSDKGLKNMEKTNRALLQYLRLNFLDTITAFTETTPENYEYTTYLPTKNMLDYVLVRLQGVGKLMCRIIESTRLTAACMQEKIGIGHFWKLAFIIYGLVSRIWVLSKNILEYCCDLYEKLLPYSRNLKNTSQRWLPEDYLLPSSLKKWLEQEGNENYSIVIPRIETVVNLPITEDEQTSEEETTNKSEIIVAKTNKRKRKRKQNAENETKKIKIAADNLSVEINSISSDNDTDNNLSVEIKNSTNKNMINKKRKRNRKRKKVKQKMS